jgi:hypothetical protein
MNHKTLMRQLIGLAVLPLLLAACGTPIPTSTSTQMPATATSAPAPTATPTMPTSESVTEWDYVVFGDSRTGMGQWPVMYADYMEDNLGIKVTVHYKSEGGRTAMRCWTICEKTTSCGHWCVRPKS